MIEEMSMQENKILEENSKLLIAKMRKLIIDEEDLEVFIAFLNFNIHIVQTKF